MGHLVLVCSLDELKPGEVNSHRADETQLALYLVDGEPFCTQDLCTHEQCFISDGGFLEGEEVECTCHGARFNVKTGAVTMLPATEPIPTFPVEVREGQVYVTLP